MPDEKEATSRVTMLWPVDLKEAVREEVGARGLTNFVLEAVRAKLGIHDAHQADSKELGEVRFLAQRLADAIALGGDYEDRESTLREMELPAWIDTTGWPEYLARAVKPEDSTPESVTEISGEPTKGGKSWYKASDGGWTSDPNQAAEPVERPEVKTLTPEEAGFKLSVEEEDDEDLHRPMALVKPRAEPEPEPEMPAIGDPGTVRQELPHDRSSGLLDRLRTKASEKGVDLSGVDLRPASSIEKAEGEPPAIPVDEGPPSAVEEPATEPEPIRQDTPIAASDRCPNCGSELVNGECWECF